MKQTKWIKKIAIAVFLISEIAFFAACESSQPLAISEADMSGSTELSKRGRGRSGEEDPFPDSEFLMVRRRDDAEDGVSTAIIGPEGGILFHASHRLEVPAGALSESVEISMSMPVSDTLLFEFGPHGIQFNMPVKLVLDFNHAWTSDLDESLFKVVYMNSTPLGWEAIPTTVDDVTEQCIGETNHFSRYAIRKFQ
ncbi:MAG: hypothetical protein KDH98_04730 [Calditrichaeota bacterium]|nr:hypothetical protein [Calditrichota bacterium]